MFSTKTILLKHKRCHKSVLPGQLDCNECDKTFQQKWKLDAHVKIHKKFACEKTFNTKDIKDKHSKIAHEGLKFYCCFYNNDEECPYQDECIFLHKDSPACRYGYSCERENCMFKHQNVDEIVVEETEDNELGENEVEDIEEEDNDEEDNDEEDNDEEDNDDEDNDAENDDDENKIYEDDNTAEEELKCDMCQFETKDKKKIQKTQI